VSELPPRLVLYDGLCGLCDRSVRWLLDRDPEGRFRFAPLQSRIAAEIRARHSEIPGRLDSIVYVETGGTEERVYWESRAIFRICSHLDGPWRTLSCFGILPRFLTDLGYRAVARIRFRIWGRRAACRAPTPEERGRFLDLA
jgi:predicted DCC family thiol-disulfide oxidoreductase YuxK